LKKQQLVGIHLFAGYIRRQAGSVVRNSINRWKEKRHSEALLKWSERDCEEGTAYERGVSAGRVVQALEKNGEINADIFEAWRKADEDNLLLTEALTKGGSLPYDVLESVGAGESSPHKTPDDKASWEKMAVDTTNARRDVECLSETCKILWKRLRAAEAVAGDGVLELGERLESQQLTGIRQISQILRRIFKGQASCVIGIWRDEMKMANAGGYEKRYAQLRSNIRESGKNSGLRLLSQAMQRISMSEAALLVWEWREKMKGGRVKQTAAMRQLSLLFTRILKGEAAFRIGIWRQGLLEFSKMNNANGAWEAEMKMVALEARFADTRRQAALRQLQLVLTRMMRGEVAALLTSWRVLMKDDIAVMLGDASDGITKKAAVRQFEQIMGRLLRGDLYIALRAMLDNYKAYVLEDMQIKSKNVRATLVGMAADTSKMAAIRQLERVMKMMMKGEVGCALVEWRMQFAQASTEKRLQEIMLDENKERAIHVMKNVMGGILKGEYFSVLNDFKWNIKLSRFEKLKSRLSASAGDVIKGASMRMIKTTLWNMMKGAAGQAVHIWFTKIHLQKEVDKGDETLRAMQNKLETVQREAKSSRNAELEAQKLTRTIHKEFDILKTQLETAAKRGGGAAEIVDFQKTRPKKEVPEYVNSPILPERQPQADKLFEALDPQNTGQIELVPFADLVNEWEPDFSKEAVMSTFKTCGGKGGKMKRDGFYKWITKVWSGLSDERYATAMKDLTGCLELKATTATPKVSANRVEAPERSLSRSRSRSVTTLTVDELGKISSLTDEDIYELYEELQDEQGLAPAEGSTPEMRRAAVEEAARKMLSDKA